MTKRKADSEFVKKCLEHFLQYNPKDGGEKKLDEKQFDEGCEGLLHLANTLEENLKMPAAPITKPVKQWGRERQVKDE